LHLETRRVTLAGITQHPTEEWMVQMARRAVDDVDGALLPARFALHDRDSKFCASFQHTLHSAGVKTLILPAQSPNLNAFAERWVRSIKSECLSKLILFREASLRSAITQFLEHYHLERPHQGKGNQLLFPRPQAHDIQVPSNVMSDSAVYSSSINVPREYFDLTGLLEPTEAASLLRVEEATLANWRSKRVGRDFVKIGRWMMRQRTTLRRKSKSLLKPFGTTGLMS
jgi:hypothetical protein